MSLKEEITSTEEGLKAWHQERAIFETTNMMCELMTAQGLSRAELAKRLKTGKSYITQMLDGTTNMTLRTISDAFLAMGYQFHPAFTPLDGTAPASSLVEANGSAAVAKPANGAVTAKLCEEYPIDAGS